MLAEPAPAARLPGLTAGWLAGRAIALAEKGRLDEAEAAAAKLGQVIAATPADASAGMNSARPLYQIDEYRAKAAIAAARHDTPAALALLAKAVALEDTSAYNEPADTFFPGRHLLGAALLAAGQPAEAEAVYLEDLKRNPENGWALAGLAKALEAQKKDATAVRDRFAKAWAHADVEIKGSAY
jgi:tetratricopeptide (TPR) repeat protein